MRMRSGLIDQHTAALRLHLDSHTQQTDRLLHALSEPAKHQDDIVSSRLSNCLWTRRHLQQRALQQWATLPVRLNKSTLWFLPGRRSLCGFSTERWCELEESFCPFCLNHFYKRIIFTTKMLQLSGNFLMSEVTYGICFSLATHFSWKNTWKLKSLKIPWRWSLSARCSISWNECKALVTCTRTRVDPHSDADLWVVWVRGGSGCIFKVQFPWSSLWKRKIPLLCVC